jgi:hypothetical protein
VRGLAQILKEIVFFSKPLTRPRRNSRIFPTFFSKYVDVNFAGRQSFAHLWIMICPHFFLLTAFFFSYVTFFSLMSTLTRPGSPLKVAAISTMSNLFSWQVRVNHVMSSSKLTFCKCNCTESSSDCCN